MPATCLYRSTVTGFTGLVFEATKYKICIGVIWVVTEDTMVDVSANNTSHQHWELGELNLQGLRQFKWDYGQGAGTQHQGDVPNILYIHRYFQEIFLRDTQTDIIPEPLNVHYYNATHVCVKKKDLITTQSNFMWVFDL